MSAHTPGLCTRCSYPSVMVVRTRSFGDEQVCRACADNLRRDGQIISDDVILCRDCRVRNNRGILCSLHAAAPALLEALEVAVTGHENLYIATFGEQADPENDLVYRTMRAAIAQAKGESK